MQFSVRAPRRFAGFTLIELLVVIAIIAILAAILFPVFAKARAKARQAACLSNMKQISLGLMMYTQDFDETLPPFRTVFDGADWWTAKMFSWKDATVPYIKNGGRTYGSGGAYTSAGDGGVFQCPENPAAWSTAPMWWWNPQGPGDETTRFPRSYVINKQAGVNELDKSIWPEWWPGSPAPTQAPSSGNGELAALKAPANTIMIVESRGGWNDIDSAYTGYECQKESGQPWGGTGYGCINGHGGGFTNFAFFDGHVKATRVVNSIKDDSWGTFTRYPANMQPTLNSANNVKEWNPGY